jgi:hypothetical protein
LNSGNPDEIALKRICHNCVGDPYLSAEIQTRGEEAECSYCGDTDRSYTIDDMADRVEAAFEKHFQRTSDEPDDWEASLMRDRESNYWWERDGDPVVDAIEGAAEIPGSAAQEIQKILADRHDDYESAKIGEECEFADDSYYTASHAGGGSWHTEWLEIERSIRNEARFFSRRAADHLAKLFAGMGQMRTTDGMPIVINAGPGTDMSFAYRARVFQSDAKLEAALCTPDSDIGSPPAVLATAGRMNARGISVFYGSNKPEVAIAEVRPPVGSQVALARFDIIRSLRILDLAALGKVYDNGSYFDPTFRDRLERAAFLRTLSERITRPVMPDDEGFDYLMTQAVADFLATEMDVPIDGILFPSVQAAGNVHNLVLFHKAALVEPILLPPGTKVEARLGMDGEDGWERDYWVTEMVPAQKEEKSVQSDWPTDLASLIRDPLEAYAADFREPTLRIVMDSIEVHVVKQIEYRTDQHKVTRHRWAHKDRKF